MSGSPGTRRRRVGRRESPQVRGASRLVGGSEDGEFRRWVQGPQALAPSQGFLRANRWALPCPVLGGPSDLRCWLWTCLSAGPPLGLCSWNTTKDCSGGSLGPTKMETRACVATRSWAGAGSLWASGEGKSGWRSMGWGDLTCPDVSPPAEPLNLVTVPISLCPLLGVYLKHQVWARLLTP